MKNRNKIRGVLEDSAESGEPAYLDAVDLCGLLAHDVPEGAEIWIGETKYGVISLDWSGYLIVRDNVFVAVREHFFSRKYWSGNMSMGHHMDLIQRSAEARRRAVGDVRVLDYQDDGVAIRVAYEISAGREDAGEAYAEGRRIADEVEAAAEKVDADVGRMIAEAAGRISGRGHEEALALLAQVESAADNIAKGRALEDLMVRLFGQVPGFEVSSRVMTTNEEIDIVVINGSEDPRFKKEGPLIVVECKNWAGTARRPDFATFVAKAQNRSGKCTFAVMVSWNGFADTVREERLRLTRGGISVGLLDGAMIREAVRTGGFAEALARAWDDAALA